MVRFKPKLVSTYSNAMHLIAKEAARRRMVVPGLAAIQGTSEPLPPELRNTITEGLGCEVFDKYGMRETGPIAHESPDHSAMLIQSENVFVEFLDENGDPCPDGKSGRIVVTPLNNFAMPMIRYQTSDLATPLGPATGDLPFPRMSHVAGRLHDLIVTPNNDHIDAYLFSYLIMRFPEVHWFQVVQREVASLQLRIYAPGGMGPDTEREIVARIQHHTGYPFKIEFENLTDMPESPTGKFRLCVSELGANPEAATRGSHT